jgi:hypothetical protein
VFEDYRKSQLTQRNTTDIKKFKPRHNDSTKISEY